MPDIQDFEIVATSNGAVTTITPRGELDMETASAFREAIVTAFAGSRYVVADLAAVTFLDSSGLAVLAVAHRRAAECSAYFEVANPRAQARDLMALTGVDKVVSIRGDDGQGPTAQA